MLELHRCRQVEWRPTAVVALATSLNGAIVAAARENGAIELWNVAAGSVGWYCHLTIPGRQDSTISSLVWCQSSAKESALLGRLFSAGLDGFITEWDLQSLQPKEVVSSNGGSVWQLAVEPLNRVSPATVRSRSSKGKTSDSDSSSEDQNSDSDSSDNEGEDVAISEQRVAVGCDDGCVRLFTVDDCSTGAVYRRSFPRVKGRILSVAWSPDAARIYAGGSNGCIHCWDALRGQEVYRITAGIGGIGGGSDLCVWCLLVLRDGTIVSGDSSGSTQFWEANNGTLLQAYTKHQADVLALASTPSNEGVFAAGADGQVILYQHVNESVRVASAASAQFVGNVGDKWVFVGNKRTHTHDVRALAVGFPVVEGEINEGRPKKRARRKKCVSNPLIHKKWAESGTPMLISGGNDAKLFTYPAEAFLAFHPHDICPAPQRPFVQLANESSRREGLLMMVQHPYSVDVWKIHATQSDSGDVFRSQDSLGKRKSPDDSTYYPRKNSRLNGNMVEDKKAESLWSKRDANGKLETHQSTSQVKANGVPPGLLATIKCKTSEHIACSAISGNGHLLALSDRLKPRLYQLEHGGFSSLKAQKPCQITKKKLSANIPAAQCALFTPDAARLLLACSHQILVVDVQNGEIMHSFVVPSTTSGPDYMKCVSPTNLMCASADGQWLAAATSSGHVNVFNLETLRHHWSFPVVDGSVVTAAKFRPGCSNLLIISTAANQLHVLHIEEKELSEWSVVNTATMCQHLLEFPGGIIGLSMPPSPTSTSIIAYSSRAMCHIDFKSAKIKAEEVQQSITRQGETSSTTIGKSQHSNSIHAAANGNGSGRKQSNIPSVNNNFVMVPFKNPVLFLGHTGQSSVVVVEKSWLEVLRQFPAPVYRHLYGT